MRISNGQSGRELPVEAITTAMNGSGYKAAMYRDGSYMCIVAQPTPTRVIAGVYHCEHGKWYLQGEPGSGLTIEETAAKMSSQSEMLGIPTRDIERWQNVPEEEQYRVLLQELNLLSLH